MANSLSFIQAATSGISPQTVVALTLVSAIFVIGELVLLYMLLRNAPNTDGNNDPLRYGNFFVVSIGITAVLIGYLVAFPLLISGVFDDPTQVLAILTAFFGAIVGLVGTFFGVKASSDAAKGAQEQAKVATNKAVDAALSSSGGGQGTGQDGGGGGGQDGGGGGDQDGGGGGGQGTGQGPVERIDEDQGIVEQPNENQGVADQGSGGDNGKGSKK